MALQGRVLGSLSFFYVFTSFAFRFSAILGVVGGCCSMFVWVVWFRVQVLELRLVWT